MKTTVATNNRNLILVEEIENGTKREKSYWVKQHRNVAALINKKAKTIEIQGENQVWKYNKETGKTEGTWVSYNRTFSIGDEVEYGSYNLIYTGKIVQIGAKTVTVEDYDRKTRLTIAEFIGRNHDLDLEKVAKRNHETHMVI